MTLNTVFENVAGWKYILIIPEDGSLAKLNINMGKHFHTLKSIKKKTLL